MYSVGDKLTFQLPIGEKIFNRDDRVNLTFDPETGEPSGIFHNDVGAWKICSVQQARPDNERGFRVVNVG